MSKKLIVFLSLLVFLPNLVSAQVQCPPGTIEGMICTVGRLLGLVLPIMIILGVLYFVWGVVQYVISDDEEAKKKGRDRMIFGIIGFAVIAALWGLVSLFMNTFGIQPGGQVIPIPELPGLVI